MARAPLTLWSALLWLSGALLVLGYLAYLSPAATYHGHGIIAGGLGLAGIAFSAFRSGHLAAPLGAASDAERTERVQARRTFLMIVASFVSCAVALYLGLVLLATFLAWIGAVDLGITYDALLQSVLVLGVILSTNILVASHLSLAALHRRRRGPGGTVALATAGTLILVAAAVATHYRLPPLSTAFGLAREDAALLLAAATALTAWAIVQARDLPTPYRVLLGRSDTGNPAMTRQTRPGGSAYVFLAGLLALPVALIGVTPGGLDLLANMRDHRPILAIIVFVAVSNVTAAVAALRRPRQREPVTRYQAPQDPEAGRRTLLVATFGVLAVIAFAVAAALFLGAAPLALRQGRWVDFVALGLLLAVGPYGAYAASREKRTRSLEQHFPDLLRDIASNHRAGLTLTEAVTVAARGDYGALTPDVRKMADQLSWHVPFAEALQQLAERISTPLVQRAVSLIVEADRSGGSSIGILMGAALDAREIKNQENERRGTMSLYTAIIYIAFFVFLGVAATLYATLVPDIVSAAGVARGQAEGVAASAFAFSQTSQAEYRSFYYVAALAQGVGNGLVAGVIAAGSAASGLRHSAVMVLAALLTFTFLL